jgi:hypothetical protein
VLAVFIRVKKCCPRQINGNTPRDAETKNPVGRGFVGQKHTTELNGFPLPNLECPDNLIRDYRDRPAPACFAPIAPNWQPRAGFAGTYDDIWQQTRAPYLPDDYNPRFMNVAPPDLIYPGYLQGGEAVRIIGMHPAGDLGCSLPYVNLSNKVLVAGQEMTSGGFNREVHNSTRIGKEISCL